MSDQPTTDQAAGEYSRQKDQHYRHQNSQTRFVVAQPFGQPGREDAVDGGKKKA